MASRWRCCICHGLNRDLGIKNGQLAHLDRNPGNHDASNLAFVCLDHHDWYEKKPGRHKALTIGEVRHYQGELRAALRDIAVDDGQAPRLFVEFPLVQWNRPPASYPEFLTVGSLPHTGQRVYLDDTPQSIAEALNRLSPPVREDVADRKYSGNWVKWSGTVRAVKESDDGFVIHVATGPEEDRHDSLVMLTFPAQWRQDVDPLTEHDHIYFEGLIRNAAGVIELVFPSITKLMRPSAAD